MTRRENDFYPTPDKLCAEIVKIVTPQFTSENIAILEPSAGDGAFVEALKDAGFHNIEAIEPYQGCPGALRIEFEEYETEERFNLIIGNPPFNLAEEHIRHALPLLKPFGTLCFLLRLNFLGSVKRIPFFKEHPPARVTVLQGRPSFSGDGRTDGCEYAVFEWRGERSKYTVMEFNDWKA